MWIPGRMLTGTSPQTETSEAEDTEAAGAAEDRELPAVDRRGGRRADCPCVHPVGGRGIHWGGCRSIHRVGFPDTHSADCPVESSTSSGPDTAVHGESRTQDMACPVPKQESPGSGGAFPTLDVVIRSAVLSHKGETAVGCPRSSQVRIELWSPDRHFLSQWQLQSQQQFPIQQMKHLSPAQRRGILQAFSGRETSLCSSAPQRQRCSTRPRLRCLWRREMSRSCQVLHPCGPAAMQASGSIGGYKSLFDCIFIL